ncbi:hypothetical protein KQI86_17290 [Clostridium sp. MSJ-11]|uniref:Uncharacterized protein n=1 Tax=Clostridium mobile TaxID=2841512 RepID=A0ABS6ELI8_9CLOT|nr:hypothetical protein [Clostridium mobile]MBU5486079.1 hypothetical protein [Clostridium mobile]
MAEKTKKVVQRHIIKNINLSINSISKLSIFSINNFIKPYIPKNTIYKKTEDLKPISNKINKEVLKYIPILVLILVLIIAKGIKLEATTNKKSLFVGAMVLAYTKITLREVRIPPLVK